VHYTENVTDVKPRRTRRSEQAEATRRRVLDAAVRLFVERGYHSTTIESIATAADVSVETIYKRFGSKAGMLTAARDAAVADAPESAEFFDFPAPPIEEALRANTDPQVQLRMLAQFSGRRLERLAPFHRMLRSAGVGDPELGHYIAADHAARRERQRDNIQTIAANGPLRLPPEQAADTYSALANPDVYLLLADHFGWSAERYRAWLVDTAARLLLPDGDG
jgi:TetR/AcrR family transcriptional regulator, regulator of autoinduction and epiphytic fitness